MRFNHLQPSLTSAPRIGCIFFKYTAVNHQLYWLKLTIFEYFQTLSLKMINWCFIWRCILFRWTPFVKHFTVLHQSIVEMAIRCAAVKSLLLRGCAPPNNPLTHSKTSSIWFLDHCRAGSVMDGTSDLSAAVLCAPPPARPWHTWQNFLLPQRMWSYQQKNKPACYQSEPEWGFQTIAMSLNQSEVQDADAFLDACGEYLCLLINVFNWTELLWGKSKRVVGGKSESSM